MALPREKVWWRSWSVLLIGAATIAICTVPALLSPATSPPSVSLKKAAEAEEAEVYLSPSNVLDIPLPSASATANPSSSTARGGP